VTWDEALRCSQGDDPELVASLRADRRFRKLVLNTENGYEYLRGQPTERNQVHHTDKVRPSSWRIVCAGGYFAEGFNGTIGHSDAWNRLDRPNHYTLTVRDEGAGAQLGLLCFWKLDPFEGVRGTTVVALADPGKLYVAYLPAGGTVRMDLDGHRGPFSARWFNPRDGKSEPPFTDEGGGKLEFRAPDGKGWVLGLQKGPSRFRSSPGWDRTAPAVGANGRALGGQVTRAAPRRRRR
jgi:hypothetical protein